MKKLLVILLALCMVFTFAVPAFADCDCAYIASVRAYQRQIARNEAAYMAAVEAYARDAKAKADAESAAILQAAKVLQAKADAREAAYAKAVRAQACGCLYK